MVNELWAAEPENFKGQFKAKRYIAVVFMYVEGGLSESK